MRLADIRKTYDAATVKASEVARQLAFAGIAIVWLFSGATISSTADLDIPQELLKPGFFLVLTLTLDFFQAVYRAGAWGWYGGWRERHNTPDDDEGAPAWINWPTLIFYWGKLVCLGIAYVQLGLFLLDRL